ncbi:GNAT family N-acetyltransferase [Stomatohabitans albus]|uniref:GNAT family N-acetyltransferase n=1 Tax=Stomatohabitans albus TaxID=3110766 RepID=UPI00300D55B5
MTIEYRIATPDDIDALVRMRLDFQRDIKGDAWIAQQVPDYAHYTHLMRTYFETTLGTDALLAAIATENGQAFSISLAYVFLTSPHPLYFSGKEARLSSVYTEPAYRKRGHAKRLIELLINELRQQDVGRITLEYTPEALPMYESLGFTIRERHMHMLL